MSKPRTRPATEPQVNDPARRATVERWIHLYRSGEWKKEVAEIICTDEKSLKEAMDLLKIPAQPNREKPTDSELQVVQCMCHGMSLEEAAKHLQKSHHTVRSQLKMAKTRSAAKSRDHLISICLREGWVEEPEQLAKEKPSPSELRVIECLSHGLGTDGTADVLFLSVHTVKSQLRDAKVRVNCKTRGHLVSICLREGWIN